MSAEFLPKIFNLADGGKVQGIDGAQAFNQLQITNANIYKPNCYYWLDTATSINVRHDYGRNIAVNVHVLVAD